MICACCSRSPITLGTTALSSPRLRKYQASRPPTTSSSSRSEPEPPVALGRRPGRLGDLLLRRRREAGVAGSTRRCGPHVRGVRAHGRSSRATPPAVGGQRREPVPRLWDTIERRCDIGVEALGGLPSRPVAPSVEELIVSHRHTSCRCSPLAPPPLICLDPGHGTIRRHRPPDRADRAGLLVS